MGSLFVYTVTAICLVLVLVIVLMVLGVWRKEWRRRRTRETADSLARDLRRAERRQPGGAPERPIEIASPSVVEGRAAALPCPMCQGSVTVEQHEVEVHADERLRVARVACRQCGERRSIYFRVVQD